MSFQSAHLRGCIITLAAFFYLLSAVGFKCDPKCGMNGQIVCIVSFFSTVNLSNVSSNCLLERMQHHIGYIYLTFPHCVFY